MDIEELFHGIIKVRGQAKALDTIAVRLKVDELQKEFKKDMQTHKDLLKRVVDKMDRRLSTVEDVEEDSARKEMGEAKTEPKQSPFPPWDQPPPLPPLSPHIERPAEGYLSNSEGSEVRLPQAHGPPNMDVDSRDILRKVSEESKESIMPILDQILKQQTKAAEDNKVIIEQQQDILKRLAYLEESEGDI